MSFTDFARSHGLVLDRAVVDGRWHRVRTEDHPRKRNGAYVYHGSHGWAQNWATMNEPVLWREREGAPIQPRLPVQVDHRRHQQALQARQVAAGLLGECDRAKHPYLARKGFAEALGLVHPSGDLLVPMRELRDYEQINSVQRISPDGGKKFIHGGKAKGSLLRLGSRGPSWLVEGYATGLSVEAALRDLHQQGQVVVCFSAGNLTYVSQFIKRPAYVFADNDESKAGETAAIKTGLPYCMAPNGDANDLMLSRGLRTVCSLMLDVMHSKD